MVDKTYYQGFEGEEEIRVDLILHGETVHSLGVWGCYFNSVIRLIPAGPDGWEGFAYYFQLHAGWYDEDRWTVPDLPLFYRQLSEIDENRLEYPEEREILHILREMFRNAIDGHGSIALTQY